jgi:hypothetical protein
MCPMRRDEPHPLPGPYHTDAEGWTRRERLTKSDAERLLDWLEANGYTQREVTYTENVGFTVRWRR